ncbi:MAG: hypothetical protein IPL83_09460 [Bdellovibrionales bacterium]|nr:hypothetical protein [Bdellovibrionales bacterium]
MRVLTKREFKVPFNKYSFHDSYSLQKFWTSLVSIRLRERPSAHPIASWRLIPSLLLTCSMTLNLSPGLPLNATFSYFGAPASAEDQIGERTTFDVDLESLTGVSTETPVEIPTAITADTELQIDLGKGNQIRLTGPESFLNDPQHPLRQLDPATQERFLARRAAFLPRMAAFLASAKGGFGLYSLSKKIITYVRPTVKSSVESNGSQNFQSGESSEQVLTQALTESSGKTQKRAKLLKIVDALLFMDPGTFANAHTVGLRIVIGAIALGGLGLNGGGMIVKAAEKIPSKLGGRYVQAALSSGIAQRIMSADIGFGGQRGVAINFGYNFKKGSFVAQAFPWRESYQKTLGVAGYLGFNLRVGGFFDATSDRQARGEYVLVPPGPGFMSKGEHFFSAGLNLPFAVPGFFPLSEIMGYRASAQVGGSLGIRENIAVSRITPFFARLIPGIGWGAQDVENFRREISSYSGQLAKKGRAAGIRVCQKLLASRRSNAP